MSDDARWTPILRALPPTVPFVAPDALQRRRGRPFRVRLGANESAFGISPVALAAMREAAGRSSWYGDPESWELRQALAACHGVEPGNLVVGSGIDDLLALVIRAFVGPGDRVVTSLGGYPTFNYHAAGHGAAVERVPYRDDRNDLAALAASAGLARARLLYLANPDNPSGTVAPAAEVERMVELVPPSCLLVLDEAYSDFAPELPAIDAEDPRVIRLRTFSKAHGLAGARIGYAIARRATIAAFERIRQHFGVNLVAQVGALASLGDPEFLAGVVAEVARGRAEYAALATRLGLSSIPSATNFVSIDVGGSDRARAMVQALADRDVFVRMPGAPPLDRCIRVTIGTGPEREAFAEVFSELCGPG
jgi:histidinol-phosphate aminotransferase